MKRAALGIGRPFHFEETEMKRFSYVFVILFGLTLLACQKAAEKPEAEGMGDASEMKVVNAPNLSAIPQIPQSLPSPPPTSQAASPLTQAASLPAQVESKPASVPATW